MRSIPMEWLLPLATYTWRPNLDYYLLIMCFLRKKIKMSPLFPHIVMIAHTCSCANFNKKAATCPNIFKKMGDKLHPVIFVIECFIFLFILVVTSHKERGIVNPIIYMADCFITLLNLFFCLEIKQEKKV